MMPAMKMRWRWMMMAMFALAGILVHGEGVPGDGFDHGHTRWATVLEGFVDEAGRVDYRGLKADPEPLHLYLRELARVDDAAYRSWSREQQLAYLINLYNAQTIDLVMRHYPLASIKDIGSLLRGPWGQPVVSLFGRLTTLDNLEHKIIRSMFAEPRTHFALVCAARSAPVLRREPYRATVLDEQLDDQARRFIRDPARNRVDTGRAVLHLSPVFKWFEGDFTAEGGTVEDFVMGYLDPEVAALLRERTVAVVYRVYDWTLND